MADGKVRPRLSDVAEAAGVSLSAASVALNGRPGVSDATRAKVQKVARRLGYVPDRAATSLRNGRSSLVAFICDGGHEVASKFANEAVAHGCLLVLARPADVSFLNARGVDGAIVSGSDSAASAWSRTGRPLVVLGPGRLPRGAVRLGEPVDEAALAAACATLYV